MFLIRTIKKIDLGDPIVLLTVTRIRQKDKGWRKAVRELIRRAQDPACFIFLMISDLKQ